MEEQWNWNNGIMDSGTVTMQQWNWNNGAMEQCNDGTMEL